MVSIKLSIVCSLLFRQGSVALSETAPSHDEQVAPIVKTNTDRSPGGEQMAIRKLKKSGKADDYFNYYYKKAYKVGGMMGGSLMSKKKSRE
jgi:hypothetical protein